MAVLCQVDNFLLSINHSLLMDSKEIFGSTAAVFSPRVFAEKCLPAKQYLRRSRETPEKKVNVCLFSQKKNCGNIAGGDYLE